MAICVLQFGCFKESWLGKFEQDDTWIFCLKAARIRRCAVASEAADARRSHRPVRTGKQGKPVAVARAAPAPIKNHRAKK
jgi:hypothetical protein